MIPPRLLLVASLVLTGCAPLDLYYRAGAPLAEQQADLTACRIQALRDVPKDIRRRYIPPVYDLRPICDGAGNCWTRRVLISPGSFEQYDANEDLRDAATAQCMAREGYEKRRIPRCDAATTDATPPAPTRVLPPLTSESCAIRLPSGQWQIVTPGS